MTSKLLKRIKVSDYKYTLEGFCQKLMIWLDVLEVFAKNHTTIVPVLDESNSYLVIMSLKTSLNFSMKPLFERTWRNYCCRKPVLDYSMSQITQIVESNNGKLLGLFISESDVEKVQVTIKISLGAMNDIIQTFRRYNYEILSEHHEDLYINNLKERSDYLDKYLNI